MGCLSMCKRCFSILMVITPPHFFQSAFRKPTPKRFTPTIGGNPDIIAKIESVGKSYGFTVINNENNLGLGRALGASSTLFPISLLTEALHYAQQMQLRLWEAGSFYS